MKLKPGDYCRPKNEQEWRAVLDLAKALGVHRMYMLQEPYSTYRCVWLYKREEVVCCTDDFPGREPIPVPDFIAGMYEIATEKEAMRPKAVEDRLHTLEVRSSLLIDILKRLTKLENKT